MDDTATITLTLLELQTLQSALSMMAERCPASTLKIRLQALRDRIWDEWSEQAANTIEGGRS